MNDATEKYVNAHSKSQVTGFILALIFGPLGLLYSNGWLVVLIFSVITLSVLNFVALGSMKGAFGVLVIGLSISINFISVSNYNKKLREKVILLKNKT